MTSRNDILDRIEDLLGSEGSRAMADLMLGLLRISGYVTFDADRGYVMDTVDESEWLDMLAVAHRALNQKSQ